MTTPADQSQHFLVPAAATAEADRLGHTVVDTDHVLVGLMSAGGSATTTLVGHGLTLARLREAMVQLQREAVADLDVDAGTSPVGAARRPAHTTEALPWTPRARTALSLGHDTALLEHLATTPGPARRLLEHVGADLTTPSATEAAATPSTGGGRGPTAHAVVGVDPVRLLDTASDPARLAAWYGPSTVAGTTRGAGTLRLELVDDHGAASTLTLVARAHGASSAVDLTFDKPADHQDGRLAGRLLRWMRTSHLRAAITSLAAAAA